MVGGESPLALEIAERSLSPSLKDHLFILPSLLPPPRPRLDLDLTASPTSTRPCPAPASAPPSGPAMGAATAGQQAGATPDKLRHVESMSELPSGAGTISGISAVVLGESLADEEHDLVFPSPEFSASALVSSPKQVHTYTRAHSAPRSLASYGSLAVCQPRRLLQFSTKMSCPDHDQDMARGG